MIADIVLIAYVLFVLWFILFRTVPLQPAMWYYLAKDWQRMARLFGEMAIGAEHNYYRTMERTKL